MPTANFTVKFLVQRNSGSTVIRFTDTSTASTFTAGNFKVTYPDGSVVQNTDYGSPDISSVGGTKDYTLKVNSSNSPLTGNYTVLYTIIADSSQDVESKTFNFEWVEPTVSITNTSDVAVPEVKFKDSSVYDQGNFTEAYNTWTLAADAPSTSDASGDTASETLTTGDRELDVVFSANYYEGAYTATLTTDFTWTSSVYAYLTVNWTKVATQAFTIKKAQSQSDIIALLNTYKSGLSSGQKEEYDYVMGLYSHLIGRAETSTLDGSEDILNELLDYIDTSTSYTYQSGPISAFSFGGYIDASGTPTSGTLTGWVDANTVKAITVGSGLTLASGELTASGGDGLGSWSTYSATLTDTQILALDSTPITVASGSSGKIWEVRYFQGKTTGGTTNYGAGQLELRLGSSATILTTSSPRFANAGAYNHHPGGYSFTSASNPSNQDLVIGASPAFTGGDRDFDIYFQYREIDWNI